MIFFKKKKQKYHAETEKVIIPSLNRLLHHSTSTCKITLTQFAFPIHWVALRIPLLRNAKRSKKRSSKPFWFLFWNKDKPKISSLWNMDPTCSPLVVLTTSSIGFVCCTGKAILFGCSHLGYCERILHWRFRARNNEVWWLDRCALLNLRESR